MRFDANRLVCRFCVLIFWLIGEQVLAADVVRDRSGYVIHLAKRVGKVSNSTRSRGQLLERLAA